MLKFAILVALIAAAAASENIHFTDCSHHEISNMQFTGCTSDDTECKVLKEHDMTFHTNFVANQDTSTVQIEMLANVGGIEIPVPGLRTDACADNEISPKGCPLVKGEKYTFTYNLNLPKLIPNVHATVILKLNGQHGPLLCAKMAGFVTDK